MRIRRLLVCVLLLASNGFAQSIRDWRVAHETEIITEYRQLLSLPNVAANLPDMRRNAELLQTMYAKRGVPLQMLEVPDSPPALFGEIRVPGATKTIVLYAHYDGQPVIPNKWNNGKPFAPELQDATGKPISWEGVTKFDPEWRIQARSASDDKAPIMAFLGALDALKAAGKNPSVNLKFFFDGEEERGSPHLNAFLEKYKSLLASDGWIFCDGPTHQSRRQLVSFGVRGNISIDLTIYGPVSELHSGHYGNWAPNPALALAHLIASMKDEQGRVLIKGFYDDVVPLSEVEKRSVAAMPDLDAQLREEFQLGSIEVPGRRLEESINVPALNIQGLSSAGVGAEGRNVIPSSARAFIGVRLVKGMSPTKTRNQIIEHIHGRGCFVTDKEPDTATRMAHEKVCYIPPAIDGEGIPAVRVPMDSKLGASVLQAVEMVRGNVVKQPTSGATVPWGPIENVLGASVVGLPIVNHDNNQHTHNENLRLQNLWDGIETMAAIMTMR